MLMRELMTTLEARRLVGRVAVTACCAVALLGVNEARHITPTVVLEKHADVIRRTLPDAQQFFVRSVEIGGDDLHQIQAETSYRPEEPKFDFFYGKEGDRLTGTVLFPQVNTQHGPFEVALTVDVSGKVSSAIVTKATVETKPWVVTAIKAGLMTGFVGMAYGDDPASALERLSDHDLGRMPRYSAEQIARAVKQGLVLYHVLYATAAPAAGT